MSDDKKIAIKDESELTEAEKKSGEWRRMNRAERRILERQKVREFKRRQKRGVINETKKEEKSEDGSPVCASEAGECSQNEKESEKSEAIT